MFAASKTAAVASAANYIEDVFSTYLYTGNGSTQTITNGIDLSGKGGMVFVKSRSAAYSGRITDTVRGATNVLYPTGTGSQSAESGITSFASTGFSLGSAIGQNESGTTFASWTFRKQAKFFDVVTYTGNGASSRQISHALGSAPGFIIVKETSQTGAWYCYHRSNGTGKYLTLNTTNAVTTDANYFPSVTSTSFTATTNTALNTNGVTYVAYLFAHNAGGFGLTGTDNVISCGSFTTDGSANATINLGYEPQWILAKRSDSATNGNWYLIDTMRGFVNPGATGGSDDARLYANTSGAENAAAQIGYPTSTGFVFNVGDASATFIYIAIRRGPMRTPTSGTSVFNPVLGAGTTPGFSSSFTVDSAWVGYKPNAAGYPNLSARLIGDKYSISSSTAVEQNGSGYWKYDFQTGFGTNAFTSNYIGWLFRRAPGFFDVVCYTGTGSNTTQTHNLGVVPELIFVKRRGATGAWSVYSAALANTEYLVLNTTAAKATGTTYWNSTTPTSTVFSLGTAADVNASTASNTYVAYLFATVAGVSKVGSYTGTGALQTINCGFAAGARFVLVKRTDSTGDWYVYDSTRGITSGNDPYILLNVTAAEVTGTNYVDTASTGFQVTAAAPAGLNANGGTYIFLAIA